MNFDAALKSVLQKQLLGGVLSDRLGLKVTRWLNVELPEVRTLRLDILGEAEDGGLIHCEVQTRNDKLMRVRMAEYAFAVYRKYGRMPRQLVIYVGAAPLRMPNRLDGPGWAYRCDMVDARDLDSRELLESPSLSDNVFAVLARSDDQRATVRLVLTRIVTASDQDEREAAMAELLILAKLRRLAGIIKQETKHVPIPESLLTHEIFAPSLRKGIKQGRKEGLEEGRREATLEILQLMITERFGRVPVKVSRKMEAATSKELEALVRRVLKASSPADLLG